MVEENERGFVFVHDVVFGWVAQDFAEDAIRVKFIDWHVRGTLNQERAEKSKAFQRGMSRLQQTWTLRWRSMTSAQTFLLRKSVATLSLSTTVMPPVSSLAVSIST